MYWMRRDLRLHDNPALREAAAAASGGALLPAFVWEPCGVPGARVGQAGPGQTHRRIGGASRWWLGRSLQALDGDLRRLGSRLTIVRGDPAEQVPRLAAATGARLVVWARGREPQERDDDMRVGTTLRCLGVEPRVVEPADLLHHPADLATQAGRPYTVFTPFWRALLARVTPPDPAAAPAVLPAPPRDAPGESICESGSPRDESATPLDTVAAAAASSWAAGFAETWRPGEAGAARRLEDLLGGVLGGYADTRDRPDLQGTSRLSPHLHWGELSAGQVWRAVAGALADRGLETEAAVAPLDHDAEQAPGLRRSAGAFLRQLGWREFAGYLLHHFPATPEHPLRAEFEAFPWRDDPAGLGAWQRGLTGYPFVDAAMRELWTTGWSHNRARMVAASFLVKHLLLPWRLGEAWFWDTLVDADLGNNTLGWQWVAGCGADAAPYFRVFNPVAQGRRHDPEGAYVRRWVPELAGLPARYLHAPWQAPADTLAAAGVTLGVTYPEPIVDHGEARARALGAYRQMREWRL